jgi:uncharacterized protein (DUF1810 family)
MITPCQKKNGRKISHWMWYIFPQPSGLGYSATSKKYAIKSKAEANDYLKHPILGKRLVEIFGSPDDLKLHSSMTLFAQIEPTETIFQAILDKFFKGERSEKTLRIIESM